MIKYLGSKRVLLPLILDAVRSLEDVRTVVDLFSGTSRVGHALKRAGFRVLANDHNWESLVRWDKPEVYGVACKRVDCRTRSSVFNSKPRAFLALEEIVRASRCRFLVVSFNNEGFVERERLESMLAERGHVTVVERDFKRYVGAQIGIYNPGGEVVGVPGPPRNREYLFVVHQNG